ncbi:thiamine pyrophosphate-binding protein [Desulforamulus aeronauticus]|uniref:Pyruvate oxidase n=1 Tax=Desulforamulus aeronauticus DSM 10349 TaxID=1121421 RepID=A0A1M6UQB8_9FIRM|nr:thiamine pyrophosphate-binding protein [Desulforamulus aeronauticus]SHK71394.1 pyruvate oxidase [Desulforamulus aeronauticus DSM 10349]
MSATVAQVIVQQLISWGVKHVFGVVGDGIFYFLDALARQPGIKYYAVRHEETAALMASAYAKLTGEIAVCTATTGPGFVHLLNGLADAQKDGVPLLAITGQVARQDIGTHKKQYLDQQALIHSLVSYSSLLTDPQATGKIMNQAYKSAISKKMAAHITIPMDLFNLPCNEQIRQPEPYLFTRTSSDQTTIHNAIAWLDKAEHPVILAGVGARTAHVQVLELAEKWGAGVVHTLGGIGVIPGEHPLALGGLGHAGSLATEKILKQADLCLRIGANWWPQNYIPQDISVIELDAKPANVGASSTVVYGLVGDASQILPELTSLLQKRERQSWRMAISQAREVWRVQMEQEGNQDGSPVPPARIVQAMGKLLHQEAVVCLDTGDHTIWFGRNFFPKQQRVILSGKWRTMGFGVPAALAAKIANPERQVVALVGDGGMGMLLADFTTAVKYDLPVVIIVVNNGGLIEEKNRMLVGNLVPEGVNLHNPNFAEFAQACGGKGFWVKDSTKLEDTLREALLCGRPALVDIISNETMVPGTLAP